MDFQFQRLGFLEIKKHDIFYIHDAGLNFNLLCNSEIPTIISLRDYLYPETLLGAFNFRRDTD